MYLIFKLMPCKMSAVPLIDVTHLCSDYTCMGREALHEFMMVIHLIFVKFCIFFTVPQRFQGQFNITTLPIGALDKVTDAGLYIIQAR